MAMHLERINYPQTMTASGTIASAGQVLKIGGADATVAVSTATSEVVPYVSLEDAADGAVLRVAGPGDIAMVKCGDAVTRGTRVMFKTGATCENASGNVQTLGIALASGVTDDLVPVLICPCVIGTA